MKKPFLRFRHKDRPPAKRPVAIKSLFSKFQLILDLNTKLLETMAVMERALGGEYIFDKAFLESSVNEINILVYQVVYSLNTLTENRFSDLFDYFQTIKTCLEDILVGGLGPYSGRLTLPYPAIRLEMQPLVGPFSASLAEFARHPGLCAPDGFSVTTTGIREFMHNNNLYQKINTIVSKTGLPDRNERLTDLITNANIPEGLLRAILDEVSNLTDRIGRDSFVVVTAGNVEYETQELSANIFKVPFPGVPEAFKRSIAGCVVKEAEKFFQEDREKEIPLAVAVYEMILPIISGTVSTLDPVNAPWQAAGVTVAPGENRAEDKGGQEKVEFFRVQRFFPFEAIESKIRSKKAIERLPDGKKSLSVMDGGLRRGSSLIRKETLLSLVESAMAAERILGKPQKIFWAQEETGRIVFTGVEPLSAVSYDEISIEELNSQLESATLLLDGGETAQMGVATGRLVHVAQDYRYESFPLGAIAVADKASPRLSPILLRAAGLITETGSSIGHLASIAREKRVPAIVGARRALELLKDGMIVTMDAGDRKVYQGIIDLLVRYRSSGMELYPTDPEYITLRQLLRWIIPLNLTDPDSPDFTSANCRTLHDIIHFAHEKAVEELLNIQSRHKEIKNLETRRLKPHIPIDIRVLDIGNGVLDSAGEILQVHDISSMPFKAFLQGIARYKKYEQQPGPVGLRDIISGMDKTYAALNNPPEYAGQNLAILTENYFNLSLRLGYHFNVITAYLSENPNKNFIYYRFVGGFAYSDRRRRRAKLIVALLESMDFRVRVNDDLVIGNLKIADRKNMESVLISLGELTVFTRQLDIKMGSEEAVEEYIRQFKERAENGLMLNKVKEWDLACSE